MANGYFKATELTGKIKKRTQKKAYAYRDRGYRLKTSRLNDCIP